MAALITVTTLGQAIWRAAVGAGCEFIGWVLFKGRNLSEKTPSIKRKRPKKARSRDIDRPFIRGEKRDLRCRKTSKRRHLLRRP
jgi:hypothetical protein